MFKIDKKVPIPERSKSPGKTPKFPWREMKKGDSFFAPGYRQPTQSGDGTIMATTAGNRTHPNSRWSMRSVTENGIKGVRVWRVA